MLDLVIKGGLVVTPSGAALMDLWIKGEHITGIVSAGSEAPEAKKTIDVSGKIVVPGGIEPHAHIGFSQLGNTWFAQNAGPAEQSLAAIWGGTTTLVDFAPAAYPELEPNKSPLQSVQEHMSNFVGNCHTDYSAHCNYRGRVSTERINQIKELIDAGFPSFKLFILNPPLRQEDVTDEDQEIPASRVGPMVDMGRVAAIMQQLKEHGGVAAIHAEDEDIVRYNYETAKAKGLWDWHNMHLIRSNLSEDISVRRVIRIAEHTGAAMYIVHTSAKEGVNAIAEARAKGLPVYGETILLYASFNADNYKEHDGMKYHTYPSLKFEEDRLRLWDGLLNGDLAFVGTDSIATSYEGKIAGRTIADVQGGNIGIEIRMGVTYTEGVIKQGMSLERYADITSTNAAKLLGFYPRKGAIAIGSDADITVIDPNFRKKLTMNDLHLKDYNPWVGWDVEGWPTTVVLRGKLVLEDRKFLGDTKDGKLIPRKIDSSVLTKSSF